MSFIQRLVIGNGPRREPLSLENLQYLHGVLQRLSGIPYPSDQEKDALVECLQQITELLIWGDQNDPRIFDYFLEKRLFQFFLRILDQKTGPYVKIQMLQSLSILFENTKSATSVYFLLSNNHINDIITHDFDVGDDEILAYYISFLKSLSLRLDATTIHFFFNEHLKDFPLYTEAIKFFNHSERMVRIAVRTIALNVFKVDSKPMREFIVSRTANPYFSNLVWYLGNLTMEMDGLVMRQSMQPTAKYERLKDYMAEHEDQFLYLNDILSLRIDRVTALLQYYLLNQLIVPLYFESLADLKKGIDATGTMRDDRVSPSTAAFIITLIMNSFTYRPLLRQLNSIMLGHELTSNAKKRANREVSGVQRLELTRSASFSSAASFTHPKQTIVQAMRSLRTSSTSPAEYLYQKSPGRVAGGADNPTLQAMEKRQENDAILSRHSENTKKLDDFQADTYDGDAAVGPIRPYPYYEALLRVINDVTQSHSRQDLTSLDTSQSIARRMGLDTGSLCALMLLWRVVTSPYSPTAGLLNAGLAPSKLAVSSQLLGQLTTGENILVQRKSDISSEVSNVGAVERPPGPVRQSSLHRRSVSADLQTSTATQYEHLSLQVPKKKATPDVIKTDHAAQLTHQLADMDLTEGKTSDTSGGAITLLLDILERRCSADGGIRKQTAAFALSLLKELLPSGVVYKHYPSASSADSKGVRDSAGSAQQDTQSSTRSNLSSSGGAAVSVTSEQAEQWRSIVEAARWMVSDTIESFGGSRVLVQECFDRLCRVDADTQVVINTPSVDSLLHEPSVVCYGAKSSWQLQKEKKNAAATLGEDTDTYRHMEETIWTFLAVRSLDLWLSYGASSQNGANGVTGSGLNEDSDNDIPSGASNRSGGGGSGLAPGTTGGSAGGSAASGSSGGGPPGIRRSAAANLRASQLRSSSAQTNRRGRNGIAALPGAGRSRSRDRGDGSASSSARQVGAVDPRQFEFSVADPILGPLGDTIVRSATLGEGSAIDLSNAELIQCTFYGPGQNVRPKAMIFVADTRHLVLAELDRHHMSRGIVRMIESLILVKAEIDVTDARRVHIAIYKDAVSCINPRSFPIRRCELVMDDHIRSLAAKQHIDATKAQLEEIRWSLLQQLVGLGDRL
eukprot:Clim_evm41s191 gene=Clim_evmTU41s191